MSDGVLFKGNIEEGSYKLIKTTDGWVLVGKDIVFAGSDITDRPQGEWIDNGDRYFRCSLCGTKDTDKWHWCHGCGAHMKGADDE